MLPDIVSITDRTTEPASLKKRGRCRFDSPWGALLAMGLIVLAGVAAYGNSFAGVFVIDDHASITENPTIQKLWPLGPVFSPPRNGETVSGRPLLNLSLALNYAISGTETWSYHLVNLGIHLANALLLLGLVRRTLQRPVVPPSVRDHALPLAWAITLLWTVHPLQTEAVTYIVERAESLVAFFYLLMLYAILRSDEAGHPRWWQGLAVVACLLGMASKEVMVTAPVMAIVYDRTFLAGTFREAWRRRGWMYVFLAATWLVLIGLVWSTGLLFRREEFKVPPWWSYALTQPWSILYYIRLAIWPHPLCAYYAWPVCQFWLEILPALVAVLVAGAAVIWAMVKRPMWGFAGFWFFGILAPTSSVIPLHDVLVERRMYLSLAAVLTLVVAGGYLVGRRWLGRRVLVVGACLVITVAVVLGVLTHQRNEDYRSELSIWEDTVRKAPNNPVAQNNLGATYWALDRPSEAIEHFEQAERIKPNCDQTHLNWGNSLLALGRHSEAIEHYEQAVRINPNYAEAHNNLGDALRALGRPLEGIEHCKQAVRIKPDYADAHLNWGTALLAINRPSEAIEHYAEAVRINPDDAEAHKSWGDALKSLDRYSEAVEHYEQALRIRPHYAAAHNNWGSVALALGRPREAIEHFDQAERMSPDDPSVQWNLSVALSQLGRIGDAITHGRQAARLLPDHPQVNQGVAWLLATHEASEGGNGEHAIELAERACVLTKRGDVTCLDTLAAAYAAAGRFDDAVATAKEAWQIAQATGQASLAEEIHIRLQLYRDRKPYREAVVHRASHEP